MVYDDPARKQDRAAKHTGVRNPAIDPHCARGHER